MLPGHNQGQSLQQSTFTEPTTLLTRPAYHAEKFARTFVYSKGISSLQYQTTKFLVQRRQNVDVLTLQQNIPLHVPFFYISQAISREPRAMFQSHDDNDDNQKLCILVCCKIANTNRTNKRQKEMKQEIYTPTLAPDTQIRDGNRERYKRTPISLACKKIFFQILIAFVNSAARFDLWFQGKAVQNNFDCQAECNITASVVQFVSPGVQQSDRTQLLLVKFVHSLSGLGFYVLETFIGFQQGQQGQQGQQVTTKA